jgi:bifunctional non-homologous end joining protein LigD
MPRKSVTVIAPHELRRARYSIALLSRRSSTQQVQRKVAESERVREAADTEAVLPESAVLEQLEGVSEKNAVAKHPITYRDLMRGTMAPTPFTRPGWIFELKYDGFRVLTVRRGEDPQLVSRTGSHILNYFPELQRDLLALPDVTIDGQLVILDEHGRPQSEQLVRRSRLRRESSILEAARKEPAVILAFDLLELGGKDLRDRPLITRKALLHTVIERSNRIQYAEHLETEGEKLFETAGELGVEGIVAKRSDSPYCAGRTRDWLKITTSARRKSAEDRE